MNLFKTIYNHSVKILILTEAAFIYAVFILWNVFDKCNKHTGLYSTVIQTHVISLTLMALYQYR